ncbi:MAG: ubiquinol-cytochrome C chaperone family protein [Geminicoccaceae bacterium]
MAREGEVAQGSGAAQPGGATTSWLARLRRRLRHNEARADAVHALYLALVAQARQPALYSALRVPDTRDGRLELIYLHAILLMRRLRAEGAAGQELSQDLFDLLFRDVDRHLREWGVGDLSVGKHVKKLAQSFYGRATALDGPLSEADRPAIGAILERNVFGDLAEPRATAAALTDYLLAQEHHLAAQPGDELLHGNPSFAAVAAEPDPAACFVDRAGARA